MKLKNIMLSEVSQAQKVKGHMIFLICRSWIDTINVHINNINTYMILIGIYIISIKGLREDIIVLIGLPVRRDYGGWKTREC
jgi:hypothetical protein